MSSPHGWLRPAAWYAFGGTALPFAAFGLAIAFGGVGTGPHERAAIAIFTAITASLMAVGARSEWLAAADARPWWAAIFEVMLLGWVAQLAILSALVFALGSLRGGFVGGLTALGSSGRWTLLHDPAGMLIIGSAPLAIAVALAIRLEHLGGLGRLILFVASGAVVAGSSWMITTGLVGEILGRAISVPPAMLVLGELVATLQGACVGLARVTGRPLEWPPGHPVHQIPARHRGQRVPWRDILLAGGRDFQLGLGIYLTLLVIAMLTRSQIAVIGAIGAVMFIHMMVAVTLPRILLQAGQPERALRLVRWLLAESGKPLSRQRELEADEIEALMALGSIDEARRLLGEHPLPEKPRLIDQNRTMRLAMLCLRHDLPGDAALLLSQGEDEDWSRWVRTLRRVNLSAALSQADRFEEAMAVLQSVDPAEIRNTRQRGVLLNNLASIQLALGDDPLQALAWAQEARETTRHPWIRFTLGAALNAAGGDPQAAWEQLAPDDDESGVPRRVRAWRALHRGRTLRRLGRIDEALAQLRQAVALGPCAPARWASDELAEYTASPVSGGAPGESLP